MAPGAEIATSRTLPFTRERVFSAFSDPERLARWWGPIGATNEFHEFDLRPGGRWRSTMRTPDGAEYAMENSFLEVDPPRRFAVAHVQTGHDFTLTVDLESVPEGTRLTWTMRFVTPEQLAPVKDFLVRANEQNLDRLGDELRRPPRHA